MRYQMDKVRDHVWRITKECGEAEKRWSDHMNIPGYCLNKNYYLYKRYIRLFNHLNELDQLLKVENPQQD